MSEHFTKIAPVYSENTTFDHEAVKYIVKILAERKNISAADIGCGDGKYSIKIMESLKEQLSLTCVDNNQEMLNQLSKIARSFKDLRTKLSSASKLPFDNESLDCIFSFNSIHHFDLNAFSKECNRILVKDGFLFIYTRLPEQNEANIWGKYFPDFSKKETRLFDIQRLKEGMSNGTSLNLESTKSFKHGLSADIETLVKSAEIKHYSTFSLYDEREFNEALEKFRENIRLNFPDSKNISWNDENTIFLFKKR